MVIIKAFIKQYIYPASVSRQLLDNYSSVLASCFTLAPPSMESCIVLGIGSKRRSTFMHPCVRLWLNSIQARFPYNLFTMDLLDSK